MKGAFSNGTLLDVLKGLCHSWDTVYYITFAK